jgi:hypothetical protein
MGKPGDREVKFLKAHGRGENTHKKYQIVIPDPLALPLVFLLKSPVVPTDTVTSNKHH